MSLDSSSVDPDIAAAFTDQQPSSAPQGKFDPDISEAFTGEPSLWQKVAKKTEGMGESNPVAGFLGKQVSSAVASVGAGAKVVYDWATGKIKSVKDAHDESDKFLAAHPPMFQAATDSTQGAIETTAASPANPLNWPGAALHAGGQAVTAGLDAAGVPSNVSTLAGPIAEGAGNVALGTGVAGRALGLNDVKHLPGVARVEPFIGDAQPELSASGAARPPYSNVGEVEPLGKEPLPTSIQRNVDNVSAEAKANNQPLNQAAVVRHLESQSLPVPVDLTEGQATQDIGKLSNEFNRRGTAEGRPLADRFNQQNGQLVQNVNALRDQAAPEAGANDTETHAQTLIDTYKAKDQAAQADISAKYKALTDANGGSFPIDGQKLVSNIDASLKQKLKSGYVPAGLQSALEEFRTGRPMNLEDFETLRTDAATAMRGPDGNARAAAGVIRQELEKLPLEGGAAQLKPLADTARAAAKARFDALEADPAYKAAVNDSVEPNRYFQRFVLNASKRDMETLKNNIGTDPNAAQAIAGGTFNHLKQRAGIVGESNGNFSQAGYNKALEGLRPKLDLLVDPQTGEKLNTLGNVARYTQAQPRGSFFNNSNSAVTLMGEHAANVAENVANVAAKGVPVGTWTRKLLSSRARQAETAAALAPGAGIGGGLSLSELMSRASSAPQSK